MKKRKLKNLLNQRKKKNNLNQVQENKVKIKLMMIVILSLI